MKLDNEFQIPIAVDEAWPILTDIERIAPCLPGAQLQEIEGDEYRGVVKIKVGPITAQYKGAAILIEKDDGNHKAVIQAEGRETRGQGKATATITATLEPHAEGTRVVVSTDLNIVGRVAQAGHGVLKDVSENLISQFVDNLETDLAAGTPADTPTEAPDTDREGLHAAEAEGSVRPPASPATAPTQRDQLRRVDHQASEPLDLLASAQGPVIKRLVPIAAVVGLIIIIVRWRR